MSWYDGQIEAKKKEIEELQSRQNRDTGQMARVVVGKCFFSDYKCDCCHFGRRRGYIRILYLSDSGHGYPLVIGERLRIEDVRVFNGSNKPIDLPGRGIYLSVGQEFRLGIDLEEYVEIPEDKYLKAKQHAISIMNRTDFPENWKEALEHGHKQEESEG